MSLSPAAVALEKQAARQAAFARRKTAHDTADGARACKFLLAHLGRFAGETISGYMPIRTEIDILPAMARLCAQGPVCVPVVQGPARPLLFHQWTPTTPMQKGAFGAAVPVAQSVLVPSVIILPLLAFDDRGYRLGYGGGFYDRTLADLRAAGPVYSVGFAYAAQKTDLVPIEDTDQRMDAVVTESGVVEFGAP